MTYPLLKQIFASVGTLANIVMHGCFTGVIALLIPNLRGANSAMELTFDQESWIMSSRVFLLLPTQFISGLLIERFGRKVIICLSTIPLMVTFIMIYFANNFVTLFTACFISGLAASGPEVGAIMVGEICSPKYRGSILNSKTLAFCVGISITHFLGNYYEYRSLILYFLIPAVISLVCSLIIPESPVWLASRGRYEESRKAFKWFRGNKEDDELNKLIETQTEARKYKQLQDQSFTAKIVNTLKFFTEKTFIKACGISCAFTMAFEFSGKIALTLYVVDLLTGIVGHKEHIYLYAFALDIVDFVALTVSLFLVKKCARRRLIFYSSVPGLSCLFSFCLFLYLTTSDIVSKEYSWISLLLLAMYFFIMSIGLMPCRFIILSEIFPVSYRGAGLSVSSIISVICMFITSKTTPYLFKMVGVHGTFLINGIITLACLLYLYRFLPETRNKTLQQIESDLKVEDSQAYIIVPSIDFESNIVKE